VSARLRLAFVATLVILVAPVARAATPAAEREARRAFSAAEAHFKAGQFASALAEYQAGYAASPLPGFLINIAQCQRRLGDLTKARATYQKFVVVAPDSPLVPEVNSLIAELDKLIADLGDGENAEETGTEQSSDTPPKPDLEPLPQEDAPAAAASVMAVAAPEPAPPPRSSSHKRWWLWGAIGAAVVGGTVAAFALSSPSTTTIHDGSLGTLRR
jgi:tetratricopeptide (TPR) repeat protein